MNHRNHDTSDAATMQAIMTALRACYGSLEEPNFSKIYVTLQGDRYRQLLETLRSNGVELTETTDFNDDVSLMLVMDKDQDQVGLSLSGVGPFAALVHQDAEERYHWITRSDAAPTVLASFVAQTVERAGLQLLDRDTVMRTIRMNRADGATEATLYQALFTDTDVIP